MKWVSEFQHPESWKFTIEEVAGAGFYVFIQNGQGRNTHDYLQDTFEIARYFAFRKFGVPEDSWQPVE